jgi:hypothetical protein
MHSCDSFTGRWLASLLQETNFDIGRPRRGITMSERIIEEHVHTGGGGGGAMTALAVVLILLVLLVVLYFSGVLGRMFGAQKHEIDININKPGVVLQLH